MYPTLGSKGELLGFISSIGQSTPLNRVVFWIGYLKVLSLALPTTSIILLLHMDHMLIVSQDIGEIDNLKKELSKSFVIKGLRTNKTNS